MTIFLVQSNLKHNGQFFKKGDLMEGDAGAFRHFVIDGTLREIEGASSFAEAEEFLASEAEKEAEAPEQEVAEPANTWEAKKEPKVKEETKVEETTTDTTDSKEEEVKEETQTIKRVITEEDLKDNPELAKLGVQVGDEIELPVDEETKALVEENKSPEDTGDDL